MLTHKSDILIRHSDYLELSKQVQQGVVDLTQLSTTRFESELKDLGVSVILNLTTDADRTALVFVITLVKPTDNTNSTKPETVLEYIIIKQLSELSLESSILVPYTFKKLYLSFVSYPDEKLSEKLKLEFLRDTRRSSACPFCSETELRSFKLLRNPDSSVEFEVTCFNCDMKYKLSYKLADVSDEVKM